MDVSKIVSSVSELLLFVVPGYIAVRLHEKYASQKRTNDFDTILCSILYSFIIRCFFSCISYVCSCISPSSDSFFENELIKQISYLLLAVAGGFFLIKFPKTKIGSWLRSIFNEQLAPYQNVWLKAMENYDNGAWATVYLQNGLIYTGKLINYTSDPNEHERELLLTNYRLALRVEGTIDSSADFCILISDHTSEPLSRVLLSYDNIAAVEINP